MSEFWLPLCVRVSAQKLAVLSICRRTCFDTVQGYPNRRALSNGLALSQLLGGTTDIRYFILTYQHIAGFEHFLGQCRATNIEENLKGSCKLAVKIYPSLTRTHCINLKVSDSKGIPTLINNLKHVY